MTSRPTKISGEKVKVNVRIAKPKNGKRKIGDKTNYFRIFTDGACTGNGKKWARAGLGVHFPKEQHPDISLPFTDPPITNQRAELAAILMAIQTVLDKDLLNGYDELVIYSDSDYSIKCITLWAPSWQRNGWKRKADSNKSDAKIEPLKNLDLIRAIYNLLPNLPIPLVFVHVFSHTENLDYRSIHNAVADKLASEGIQKLAKYQGGAKKNRTREKTSRNYSKKLPN
jgi:ribonuclease HI